MKIVIFMKEIFSGLRNILGIYKKECIYTIMNDNSHGLIKENRNMKLDICRGIACWLVILGHTIQYCYAGDLAFYENVVFRFIYGFHMPFFMIISGYLFCKSCQKYNLKNIINKQTYHILYPLLIWNSIDWLCKLSFKFNEIRTFEDFLNSIYKSLSGLWFLWSIFIISIFIAIVYFNFLGYVSRGIGYIVAFIVLILLPEKVELCKTMNIWMYPYFLTGFLLYEKRDVICKLKCGVVFKMRYVIIFLYPMLLRYFHFDEYIYTSGINPYISEYGFIKQIQIDIFRWILGYMGIIFVTVILQILFQKSNIKRLLGLIFGKLGQVTLQIYVLQRILLEEMCGKAYRLFVDYRGENPLVKNVHCYNMILAPLLSSIFLLLIYKFIALIKRRSNLYRLLFGSIRIGT